MQTPSTHVLMLALLSALVCAFDWHNIILQNRASSLELFEPNNNCSQAWIGSGTGAWYRVDTLCNTSNYFATSIEFCFPLQAATFRNDGLYQSLGVYNTQTGAGADVGFTSTGNGLWSTYVNSAKGWISGQVTINATLHPCADILFILQAQNASLMVAAGSTFVGRDTFAYSQVDSDLFLNNAGKNIGFYRFDSIAQNKPETLQTGSYMVRAQADLWKVYDVDGEHLVQRDMVALQNRGFAVGPCCSDAEKQTIQVLQQQEYHASTITIKYSQ